MDSISYEIFQTLVKSDKWNFDEIQIFDNDKTIKLTIQNKTIESDFSNIKIKFIDVNKILNQNLPSNTRKLLIEKKYPDDKISLLNNLPDDLKKLKLVNIDAKLNNLPCGLEVLELHGRMSNQLDYLPESLKTLIIYKYDGKLDDLPVGLENLFLMNEYYGNLCNLPLGLKFIHLYAPSHIPNIKLPPNTKCVNFNDDNNKLRRKFIKLYPKVSYNDMNYEDNIEKYTEKIQFVKFNNYVGNYDNDSDDFDFDSDFDSDDNDFDE
jgi:hypothetical protein